MLGQCDPLSLFRHMKSDRVSNLGLRLTVRARSDEAKSKKNPKKAASRRGQQERWRAGGRGTAGRQGEARCRCERGRGLRALTTPTWLPTSRAQGLAPNDARGPPGPYL